LPVFEEVDMGDGAKLTRKQEATIAGLLSCRTIRAAARKAGIAERTLRGWLKLPAFVAAYRSARRQVLEQAIGQLQRSCDAAVKALQRNLKCGHAGTEVRAAVAILDHAFRGGELADVLYDEPMGAAADGDGKAIDGTAGVVRVLAAQLARIDAAELGTADKARLTATLADALLRAIGVDVIDKRLEALQSVLMTREKP
jgi:hypothetical protein